VSIRERCCLEAGCDDLLFADGFDDAILGVIYEFGCTKVCYDKDRIIRTLARDMSPEDAEGYFKFNIAGAYVGPYTPAFLAHVE
jgi:hypothetical protein